MYSINNFLTPITTETVLKINDIFKTKVHIINDYKCTIKADNEFIYVKQNNQSDVIILDFKDKDEANLAHVILRTQLNILGNNLNPTQTIIPELVDCCEDCEPNRHQILLEDIQTQSNLIPNTAPLGTSGVVEKVINLDLIHIVGTFKFSHPNFIDIIPPYLKDGSYAFILKTYNDVVIPLNYKNQKVNLDCGILNFKDGFSTAGNIIFDANRPPKITFFKYVGNKGQFSSAVINPYEIKTIALEAPNTVQNVDYTITVNATINIVLGFYVNGILIDNISNLNYTYISSIGPTTDIVQKGTADYVLEDTDVITITYTE